VEYTEGYAEYDDNGHILREERYEPDGTLNTLTVNTYNENGELVQTEQYDQDDILLQKTVNKYDENQRLASQSNYYGDASEEYVTKYYYDAEGNVVKQEVYVDGNLDYVEKTAIFVNGLPDTVTENDDYGNAMYVHHYQ
jgi:antitoxin component YwqK of YwqJK toxin-antitoxin module